MSKTGIPEAIEALEKAAEWLALAWAEAEAAGDDTAKRDLSDEREELLRAAKGLRSQESYL